MKQYIVNLTNHLISKNRFDEMFYCIEEPAEFVKHIKRCLCANDVRIMSPEKLGEIMCLFDIGDVTAGKKDLFNGVHFSGDCEELLRELVSLCLAFAIRDRLSEKRGPGIPRWKGRVIGLQSSFRNLVRKIADQARE